MIEKQSDMKQELENLIERYRGKEKACSSLLDKDNMIARIVTKRACYREIITELERILKIETESNEQH